MVARTIAIGALTAFATVTAITVTRTALARFATIGAALARFATIGAALIRVALALTTLSLLGFVAHVCTLRVASCHGYRSRSGYCTCCHTGVGHVRTAAVGLVCALLVAWWALTALTTATTTALASATFTSIFTRGAFWALLTCILRCIVCCGLRVSAIAWGIGSCVFSGWHVATGRTVCALATATATAFTATFAFCTGFTGFAGFKAFAWGAVAITWGAVAITRSTVTLAWSTVTLAWGAVTLARSAVTFCAWGAISLRTWRTVTF